MATKMAEGLEELLAEAASALASSLRGDHVVASAPAASHPFVAAALAVTIDAPVLAVGADPRAAQAVADGAAAWLGPDRVVLFPAWESLPYEGISPGPLTAGRRAAAAHRLRRATGPMVVAAPVLAVLQRISPELGAHDPLTIARDATVDFDGLLEHLTALGYARVDVVEHRGEFAVRGGILDVFPSTARRPGRAELFGDQIESLREFSTGTQLSTGPVEHLEIHPCRELIADRDTRSRAVRALERSDVRGQYRSILERLTEGMAFEGMEQAIPLLYDRLPFVADLLPSSSRVVLAQSRLTAERAARVVAEADALAEASEWPGPRVVEEPEVAFGGRDRADLSELSGGHDLGIRPWGGGGQAAAQPMATEAVRLHRGGARIVVAAEGRGSLDRSVEVLESAGLPRDETVAIRADVEEGFVFESGALALLTEEDLFGRRRYTREAPRLTQRRAEGWSPRSARAGRPLRAPGARRRPLRRDGHRAVGGVGARLPRSGLRRRGDRSTCPVEQVGCQPLRRRRGRTPSSPAGLRDWVAHTKAKVRRKVREMAGELVRAVVAERLPRGATAFGPDRQWPRGAWRRPSRTTRPRPAAAPSTR